MKLKWGDNRKILKEIGVLIDSVVQKVKNDGKA